MHCRYFAYALPLLVAAACSSDDSTRSGTVKTDAVQQQNSIKQLIIPFSDPVAIDSSDFVMYPLPLEEIITSETDDSYGSRSSRSNTHWNILFYNPKTKATRLLDEDRKMSIQSYTTSNSDNSASNKIVVSKLFPVERLLYFMVKTTDFNHDGKLDENDPTYLFTSDKSGEHFQQISPDSLHVTNWEAQQRTGKILLQTLRDSNHNRQFDARDESIPYVYDVAAGQPATRVFSEALVKNLKLKFRQNWGKKP